MSTSRSAVTKRLIIIAAPLVLISAFGLIFRDSVAHWYRMAGLAKTFIVKNLTDEQRRGASRLIVESCMGVKRGETVLIIVQDDLPRRFMASYHEAEARRLGALPSVIYCDGGDLAGEPPAHVVREMMKADVILAVLGLDSTQIFAHTRARNDATAEGARIGLAPLLWPGVSHDDILKIRTRTELVARIMESGTVARITGPDGTDLSFRIKGRKCERLRASMWEKGEWGAVPIYAEAALAPVEGTANGRYVVNRFFEKIGRITKPFAWIIRDGRIVAVEGKGREADRCRRILASADVNGSNIAELGVATNHVLQEYDFTGTVIDKMILGTIHIACGKNTTFDGGTVYSTIHHDAVSSGMTLEIDRKKIIENGRWMID